MKRTRILSIVLITLLLTFLLSPNAPAEEKKSVAPSVLEKLNNQAYSTTYDILEKDGLWLSGVAAKRSPALPSF